MNELSVIGAMLAVFLPMILIALVVVVDRLSRICATLEYRYGQHELR